MIWNIFQWRSLKTRVTLFTLAIFVISIWSLAFYASRTLQEDMQRQLGEQQFSTASFMALQINEELTLRLTALEQYAAGRLDPSMLGAPAALQTRLEGSPTIQSMFNAGLFITGLDGIVIASVPPTYIRVGLNYSDWDFIITATKEEKSSIGKPRVGVAVKAPVIAMSAPIRDAKGKVIGVLVGVTDFRVALAHAPGAARVELPATLDGDVAKSEQPHQVLADATMNAIQAVRGARNEFDLVLLYLPERWNRGFEVTNGGDFDLHDFLKANCASLGIPLQIVNDRDNGALGYYCRCSVAWRLSIALYCKAGGVPWTMADTEPDVAYIGVSYALRGDPQVDPRFAICCSQVFDGEGAGLDFIAYEAEDVRVVGHNPFLSRQQMMKVMSRSLDIYQRRHSGRKPARIVVHKNTEFRRDEIDGCFDAFASVADVELVHVQQNVSWRGIYMPRAQNVDGYPVPRGAFLVADGTQALLWTQGNARNIVGGDKNYYKEGKGIPEPLLIRRFAGQGDIAATCRAILALSKMDWNNDGPYDRLPVTISYASVLANIVKRMRKLGNRPYPFRLFM
jgi:hypothetical protein